jgi:hypothetical protein
MQVLLALSMLVCAAPQEPVYHAVPLDRLELAEGSVLPRYGGQPPWAQWGGTVTDLPWATLDGQGEVVFLPALSENSWGGIGANASFGSEAETGELVLRFESGADLAGTLYMPKSNGAGFLALGFRVPEGRESVEAAHFERALLRRYEDLLAARIPGGAWFRHRRDALVGALDVTPSEPRIRTVFRPGADALELFTGGRALHENLQLERGLPVAEAGAATIELSSLDGIGVKAIDWGPLLTDDEVDLDQLAALVPADQHALFFRSFASFLASMDEADRFGTFGLSTFEGRSSDAGTRARYERQLCLELSSVSRTFGPLVVESVGLTGSDAYLRTGSDVAILFRCSTPEVVHAYVVARQEDSGAVRVTGEVAGTPYQGALDPERRVSSFIATLGQTVVVTNSLSQLERIVGTSAGEVAALATSDEYLFFRQRYSRDEVEESALLVLTDETIRRWCSPRWRIGSARVARAAAELMEKHAEHLEELIEGATIRDLGLDADFPDLGQLSLTPAGVHSGVHGTLDFMTPISELELERVTDSEASLYRRWRAGYERAWSNFFDPIGIRLSIIDDLIKLDMTVMPLIGGTEYDGLRDLTSGPGLERGEGDAHPQALVHYVMALDPQWGPLRSIGATLGEAGQRFGVDPLNWLGGWLALYVDDGEFWDEVLQTEELSEVVGLDDRLNEIPLAVTIGVANPMKLALFMVSLRAFVEGTAPGMTTWSERVSGEQRFVEISSPGMGEEFSLFYATTPTALILSLHEPTLLAAMEREESRRGEDETPAQVWDGSHVGLDVRGRGVELLKHGFGLEQGKRLRAASWGNLPILNEWKRLHPELDPLELHARVFRDRLVCPGGGSYSWNPEWHTMESSVFGHPGEPRPELPVPPGWSDLEAGRFALTFEDDGLRVRFELERR